MFLYKRVTLGVSILAVTTLGMTGCAATGAGRSTSGTTPPNSQTAAQVQGNHGNNTASNATGSGATAGLSGQANSSSAGTQTTAESSITSQAAGSQGGASAFPTIVTMGMAEFPTNVLTGAKAPTVLPQASSGSNQMYYRTWQTATGPILNYSVLLSSATNRLAAFMGSTYSGISAGDAVSLPNGVPQDGRTVNSTVQLSDGITAKNVSFTAPKGSAKEVSSGSLFWNEGRWQIEVSRTESTKVPVAEADLVAGYLHSHFMPVPNSKGSIFVNVFPGENANGQLSGTSVNETIKWQEGSHVYEVDTYSHAKNPIQTGLAMAISMKPYSNSSSGTISSAAADHSTPHVTLESIQVGSSSLTLMTTHGTMQTAYRNPQLAGGVFTVTLVNMSLAPGLTVGKTYTKDGISYVFAKSGSNLNLIAHLSSKTQTVVQTGIGGGDLIDFVFQ